MTAIHEIAVAKGNVHIHRITFNAGPDVPDEIVSEAADGLLGALRMNGQILGRDHTLYGDGGALVAIVRTPEPDSLGGRFHGRYVREALDRGRGQGIDVVVGDVSDWTEAATHCQCASRSGLVLYAAHDDAMSPLRCLDCFAPVSLYHLPVMGSGEFHELICWQSDFESCDRLRMNCATLERAATREISELRSALSIAGRGHADELARSTGLPVYYALHRAHGRSLRTERARRCPGCDGAWLLPEALHGRFDFRCDACRLLSRIGFDVERQAAPATAAALVAVAADAAAAAAAGGTAPASAAEPDGESEAAPTPTPAPASAPEPEASLEASPGDPAR